MRSNYNKYIIFCFGVASDTIYSAAGLSTKKTIKNPKELYEAIKTKLSLEKLELSNGGSGSKLNEYYIYCLNIDNKKWTAIRKEYNFDYQDRDRSKPLRCFSVEVYLVTNQPTGFAAAHDWNYGRGHLEKILKITGQEAIEWAIADNKYMESMKYCSDSVTSEYGICTFDFNGICKHLYDSAE